MVTIKIERDKSCEMAKVTDGVGNGMEGNYWDFHNGCHGIYDFGEFSNVEEFAYVLKKYHEKKGEKVEIVRLKYKFSQNL
jgi:hypothetical protein